MSIDDYWRYPEVGLQQSFSICEQVKIERLDAKCHLAERRLRDAEIDGGAKDDEADDDRRDPALSIATTDQKVSWVWVDERNGEQAEIYIPKIRREHAEPQGDAEGDFPELLVLGALHDETGK